MSTVLLTATHSHPALPELVHESKRGARFELRKVPSDEPGMSPLEIWCNESQERYVLALDPNLLPLFEQMCARERCPFGIVGRATEGTDLALEDGPGGERAIDMPMEVLLGKTPKVHRDVTRVARELPPIASSLSVMMIPVLGVFSGALGLGEALHWQDFAAVALIVGGIVVSARR